MQGYRVNMAASFLIMLIIMNFILQSAESKICTGYVCGDGTCVNGTHCDGVAQCADGSDEIRCERSSLQDATNCPTCSDCLKRSGEQTCAPGSYCDCCTSSTYSSNIRCGCSFAKRCDETTDCNDAADDKNCITVPVGIIVGSSIGGGFLVCCLVAIITIARIVCYAKKSNQQTTTNTAVGTTTVSSTAYTAVGQTFNQPGFQLQNCGINVKSATNSEKEAVISELSLQAPPSYYAGTKSVFQYAQK